MSVSPISNGAFAAMAAGARGELRATTMRSVFDGAGLLDENLAQGLDALEHQAHDLTQAGVAKMRGDLVGTLIDVLG